MGTKGSLISSTAAGGIYGMLVTDNLYVAAATGVLTYRTTNEASYYQQEAGIHRWHNAASGSAGASATLPERMRIAAGNVGIGTTAPAYPLDVTGAIRATTQLRVDVGSGIWLLNTDAAGNTLAQATRGANNDLALQAYGGFSFAPSNAATVRNHFGGDGTIHVGAASFTSTAAVSQIGYSLWQTSTATTDALSRIIFHNGNGSVGQIYTHGSATVYVTSSDYRLKNTIAPMTGALAKVALLKPVTYKWNADDSDGQGFIAHELQEVIADGVYGEKDGVDAEGEPEYQGVDASFLVATLTAAIQEQQVIIEALTTRITALEG
tara:strand:- start:221 stop:1186 length:966 start_codon:yes stop_codon:yes gene_type:complete